MAPSRPSPSDVRERRNERRATARRPARHAPELAGLTLDELRAYRQELVTEESRISYWRRLLHARLDLVAGDARTLDRMRAVLSEHASDSRRLAMTRVGGDGGPAPLPDVAALWESHLDELDELDDDESLVRLAVAERGLSAYRRALHERLDAATGELIMRYRAEPTLALRALPLPRHEVPRRQPA